MAIICPKCAGPITQGQVDLKPSPTAPAVPYHLKCLTCKKCAKQLTVTSCVLVNMKSSMFANKKASNFYCQPCIDKGMYDVIRTGESTTSPVAAVVVHLIVFFFFLSFFFVLLSDPKLYHTVRKAQEMSGAPSTGANGEKYAVDATNVDADGKAAPAGCCIIS